MKTIRTPRLQYGFCLGTFPIEEARRIKSLMKGNPTCNVEFRLRGRGSRPKEYNGKQLLFTPYKDYLPLKLASHAAIYVSMKKSLRKMQKAAEIKYKMLESVNKATVTKTLYNIDPTSLGKTIAQSIITTQLVNS